MTEFDPKALVKRFVTRAAPQGEAVTQILGGGKR